MQYATIAVVQRSKIIFISKLIILELDAPSNRWAVQNKIPTATFE